MVVLKSLSVLCLVVYEPEIDMLGLLQYPAFRSEQNCVQSQPECWLFVFPVGSSLRAMPHFDRFRIRWLLWRPLKPAAKTLGLFVWPLGVM